MKFSLASVVAAALLATGAAAGSFARGSEYRAEDMENPNHLLPAIHPRLNRRDVQHLHSRQNHQLFYTQNGGIKLQDADMVATLDAKFHWEAVILDHSASVKAVSCALTKMTIQLDTLDSFNLAKKNWTQGDTVIFVSSAPSCHSEHPGQYGYFNATQFLFNQARLTANVLGKQIDVKDAVAEYNLVWGNWEAAGSPRPGSSTSSTTVVATTRSSTSSTSATNTARSSSSSSSSSLSSIRSSSTSSARSTSSSANASSSSTNTSSRTNSISSTSSRTSSATASTSSTNTSSRTSSISSTSSRTGSATSSSATIGAQGFAALAGTSSSSTTTRTSSTSSRETFAAMVPPTGTGICGVPPSPLPQGISPYFKKVACDADFDKNVDNFLTRLVDVSNLDAWLAKWAPNTNIHAADLPGESFDVKVKRSGRLYRRDVWDTIGNAVVAVAEVIIAVVKFVGEVWDAAMSLAPTYNPSASFRVEFDMEPAEAQLDESPWGDAYEMVKFKDFKGSVNYGMNMGVLAKLTGADQLITVEIDGFEEMPEPGVTVWCVDCFAEGDIQVTGSATFTAIGPTSFKLGFDGRLEAQLQLGINAYMEYEKPIFKIRMLEAPILGYTIPGVVSIGAFVTLDFETIVKVEALGQLLAGIDMQWNKIGAEIDFIQWTKSKGYGFAPVVSPLFNVSGEVNVTASVGLPLAVNVGVDILKGTWKETIALVNRPAVQAKASYKASYVDFGPGTGQGEVGIPGCKGIYYYSNLINEFELQVFNKWKYDMGSWEGDKFLEGCRGDNGESIVKEKQSPPPAGKTRLGCTLLNEVFKESKFNDLGPWKWARSDGAMRFDIVRDDKTQSAPNSLSINKPEKDLSDFWCVCVFGFGCCPEDPQDWEFEISQDMNFCTWSQYNFNLYSRLIKSDGACKVESFWVHGITDKNYNKEVNIDLPILPVTPQNQGMLKQLQEDIAVSMPSENNAPSNRYNVGIKMKCVHASYFDIRLDDFQFRPDASAFNPTKRDLLLDGGDVAESNVTKRQGIPAIPPAMPALPPANNAPVLAPTQAAPWIAPANGAPTIAPANNAPAFEYVPGNNVVKGTWTIGMPIPTATARLLGPADYNFPPRESIMALAESSPHNQVAPIASSGKPFTGWSALGDFKGNGNLATAKDGNFYLVDAKGGPSAGTSFFSSGSVAMKDEQARLFHFFPDTMSVYGVSRLRVASVMQTPLTAQLVTLIPVDTPAGVAYVAADTSGHNYFLAQCKAPRVWQGSKVFLVRDYEKSLATLAGGDVQWIVTGNNVTDCKPLILTSGAGAIKPE